MLVVVEVVVVDELGVIGLDRGLFNVFNLLRLLLPKRLRLPYPGRRVEGDSAVVVSSITGANVVLLEGGGSVVVVVVVVVVLVVVVVGGVNEVVGLVIGVNVVTIKPGSRIFDE